MTGFIYSILCLMLVIALYIYIDFSTDLFSMVLDKNFIIGAVVGLILLIPYLLIINMIFNICKLD